MSSQNRDITFDLMKGIAIVCVLLGHFWPNTLSANCIESFHMPLFFLLSGYFYRSTEVSVMLRKDAKRLLLPYAIVMTIVMVIFMITDRICTIKFILAGILSGIFGFVCPTEFMGITFWSVFAMWFLMALFIGKNLYNILYRNISNQVVLGIVCFILSGVGLLLYNRLDAVPCNICQALLTLPYLFVGNMYRIHRKTTQQPYWRTYFLPLILLIWVLVSLFSHERHAYCSYTNFPLDFTASLLITYLIYVICSWLKNSKNGVVTYISWLGKNSLAVLCIHDVEYQMHLFTRYMGLSGCVFHTLFVLAIATGLIWGYNKLQSHWACE